jgi:hypothetical protein
MKFIEIRGGLLQPVSNEENIILEMIKGHIKPMPKSLLDDRQKELARNLVTRGLLTRLMYEGQICFFPEELEDLPED